MSDQRSSFVDQARGFALLGIILVNAPLMASPEQTPADIPSQVARIVTATFADGKFYILFSFLFGYSVSRYLRPDTDQGWVRYAKRLVFLALMGALHVAFAFAGDILIPYAFTGVMFLLFPKLEDASLRLLAWIVGILSAGMLFLLGIVVLLFDTAGRDGSPLSMSYEQALRAGTYMDTVIARIEVWPLISLSGTLIQGGPIIVMMLLGYIAGRHKILDNPSTADPIWSRSAKTCLIIGLPIATLCGAASSNVGAQIMGLLFAPILTMGYLGILVRLYENGSKALRFCQSAGQMSLTCYLLESVFISLIFSGWSLGLFGKVTHLTILLTSIGVWFLLCCFARGWLRTYKKGPVEAIMDLVITSRKA